MKSVLLCDPALVMPPPKQLQEEVIFWTRLIEWSSDNRLRLGPSGYAYIESLLGEVEWPNKKQSAYPPGLGQLAYRALGELLQKVLKPELDKSPHALPALDPSYLPDVTAGEAIVSDALQFSKGTLSGLATDEDHWEGPIQQVQFVPPPPDPLEVAVKPHDALAGEADQVVASYLHGKRITIVGDKVRNKIVGDLYQRFKIDRHSIRWIGSEKGQKINLKPLDGIQARVDVVYCVTGKIGHAGSGGAKAKCQRRGVELRKVTDAAEICDDLCRRHGRGDT